VVFGVGVLEPVAGRGVVEPLAGAGAFDPVAGAGVVEPLVGTEAGAGDELEEPDPQPAITTASATNAPPSGRRIDLRVAWLHL